MNKHTFFKPHKTKGYKLNLNVELKGQRATINFTLSFYNEHHSSFVDIASEQKIFDNTTRVCIARAVYDLQTLLKHEVIHREAFFVEANFSYINHNNIAYNSNHTNIQFDEIKTLLKSWSDIISPQCYASPCTIV